MPIYNWQCTKCDTVWEIFQSMTEHAEEPPKYCKKCNPEFVGEGTLKQVHFPGSLPKFKITGGGYYPDKMQ